MFAVRHLLDTLYNKYNFFRNYSIGVVSLNSLHSVFGECRNSRGLRSFRIFIIVIILLMRHPVKENCNIGNNSTYTATPNGATTEQLAMINSLATNSLTDYKLRHLREVLTDRLDDLHDTINEEVTDTYTRGILFEKSDTIHALFEILNDILPQMPDYFEQVNMALNDYESLLTPKNI